VKNADKRSYIKMKKKKSEEERKKCFELKKTEYIGLIEKYKKLYPYLDQIPFSIKIDELSNSEILLLCSALFDEYKVGVTMEKADKEYYIKVYV